MTLRHARTAKKLTQEQLADMAGVDQATISNLENAHVDSPAWPTVYRISRALRMRPEVLFPVADISEARS